MAELKASEQGLKQIQQARNKKGWTVENPQWLVEASKILDPKRDWEAEGGDYNAIGVSSGTWKAFLYNRGKKGIRTETFKAYCQVLDIGWEEVIEQTIENPGDLLQGNEANHLAERFNKAVQQLGSNDDWILLSSIDELEQIAKDAEERYYWRVMETLTRYVRKRSPWNKEKEAKAKTEQDIPPLPDDIQRVMTVLARRNYTYGHYLEPQRLDLQNVNLQGLKLPAQLQANMKGVDFSGANLVRADLLGANLQEAIFAEANLNDAILDEANLNGAQFKAANLNGAQFRRATLQKAVFTEAKLRSAYFFWSGSTTGIFL